MKTNNRPIWDRHGCCCEAYDKCGYCTLFDKEYDEYVNDLEKENQELKDKSLFKSLANMKIKAQLQLQQDNFIKVVESVLNDNLKEIEYGQISNSQIIEKIKSAIEKYE